MRRAIGRLLVALGMCAVAVGRKLADGDAERLRRSIEAQCRDNRRQALQRFGYDDGRHSLARLRPLVRNEGETDAAFGDRLADRLGYPQ